MPRPQKLAGLYVVNGWYLEFPGLISPHFATLEGIEMGTEKIKHVDAGTNREFNFSGQILAFGDMTLTRPYQGTPDDVTLERLVQQMVLQGTKYLVTAVKMHEYREIFRVVFDGFNIGRSSFPGFDVNSTEAFNVTYQATCDGYKILR